MADRAKSRKAALPNSSIEARSLAVGPTACCSAVTNRHDRRRARMVVAGPRCSDRRPRYSRSAERLEVLPFLQEVGIRSAVNEVLHSTCVSCACDPTAPSLPAPVARCPKLSLARAQTPPISRPCPAAQSSAPPPSPPASSHQPLSDYPSAPRGRPSPPPPE